MALEPRGQPRYEYYCVVDFECTCDRENVRDHEIIEFPAVFLNADTHEIDFEFHRYVRPTESPRLSDFCKEFTGISQADVDGADTLKTVLIEFNDFCEARGLVARRSV